MMKKDIKILLLFPPISDPMHPYLSLPSLTAFLRQNGYNVTQRDLNIEAYHALLTKPKLRLFYESTYNIFKKLKSKNTRTLQERFKYESIAEALLYAPHTIENIDKAKIILRDKKRFYDLKHYSWSARIFHNALRLILREDYPYSYYFRTRFKPLLVHYA